MSFTLAEDPADDMLERTARLPRSVWVRLMRCCREANRGMTHVTLDEVIRTAIEDGLPVQEADLPRPPSQKRRQRRKPKKRVRS